MGFARLRRLVAGLSCHNLRPNFAGKLGHKGRIETGNQSSMRCYRLYVLTRQERITDSLNATHASDEEALNFAEALRGAAHAVEVWLGERLIGRVGAQFELA
jgi:hypothetical protein